jgi:EAL domain-containing protein (putative c-di-GMP-specific phosphodiesterase class I)/CheY-like chemotaxis protein
MNDRTGNSGGPTASISDSPAIAPGLPPAGKQTRVCFVVDDEPGIQNIIALAAQNFGMQVERFASAAKAIAALKKFSPSLVFLDVSLEGSDAIDVIRGFGAAGFHGTVQLMSGKDPLTIEEVRRVGERHSLVMLRPMHKPFRLDKVRAVIQSHIEAPTPKAESCAGESIPAARANDARVDLDAMLRKDYIEVWYQPKIDLRKMQFAGAEALVRCRHPERGLLSPGVFLPGADQNLMIRLTEKVLLAALRDWTKFAQAGFPLKLAVNVPVCVLGTLPIHTIVRDHRPQHDKWPGLILEVTEDQAMQDITLLHEAATQLRIHDILLSVDDFGTGYSHLARLRELPFAEVKIDRSLVANCGENKENASLCNAAIELAHTLGMTAVAEGIESTAELTTLAAMGCDLGQGYLFAKPMMRDQLLSALVKRVTAPA